jgi:hypothetical protein
VLFTIGFATALSRTRNEAPVSLEGYTTKHLAARILAAKGKASSDEVLDFLSGSLAKEFDTHFGQVVLPRAGETCAIAPDNPKTAALFFDRIWFPFPHDKVLEDIVFYGGTQFEIWSNVLSTLMSGETLLSECELEKVLENSPIRQEIELLKENNESALLARVVAEAFRQERGIDVIPIFTSGEAMDRAYVAGDRRALLVAVESLNLINESELTWEHVIEIRRDTESTRKLRQLRHWADSLLEGKSVAYISDEIGVKLAEYEWTMRKHGIKTVLGSMQTILDSRFIGALSILGCAMATGFGPKAGLLSATIPAMAKAGFSVGEALLNLADARRGPGAEVAFVYDLSKRTS